MNTLTNVPEMPAVTAVPVPTVYVKETMTWEYKRLIYNLAKEEAPDVQALNALGADGWELCASFTDSPFLYFYFKRTV